MTTDLRRLKQFFMQYRFRLLPVWILLAVVAIFLLTGWASMFPPGESYILPVRRLYNTIGVFTLRITSVICLAALPLLLIGLFWALRRLGNQSIWQDDMRIAYGLTVILSMIASFIIPLVISTYLLPDFIYPGEIAQIDSDTHRYILDVHEGSDDNPDTFIIHECDANGMICKRVLTMQATLTNGWDREVIMEIDGQTLRVRNETRTIHVHVPE